MIKRYLLVLILIVNFNLQGQERVVSFKNEELSKRVNKDSYNLSNAITKDLALLIIERKTIAAYLFNAEFEQLEQFQTTNIKSKYNEVLGYSVEGTRYNVLYTNQNHKKFAIFHLDFSTKTSSTTEVALNLEKGELFLEAITYNNELYILTGDNYSNLSIRQLDSNFTFQRLKTFQLEEINAETSLISSKVAIGAFVLSGNEAPNITKIDPRSPSSIERASSANKIYQDEETLYLTFDNNKTATLLYSINLETLDLKIKSYPYPKPRINDSFKKFNSYIFQNKIFQIASSKAEMAFEIKDFEGQLIKDYYVSKAMTIDFKNSPIIQEGATAIPFVNTRKLEQTSKYLRKISAGNLGINVQLSNKVYYVTLGGYLEINTSGIAPVVSTPTVSKTGFISFNTTYKSYNYYTVTKSTFFNTILDSNFNHIEGAIESNAFDKITAYKSDKAYLTAEDVFFHNNELYFGVFNLKESEYTLLKF